MPSGIDLPDINIWLALTSTGHPHHLRAQRYWEEESAERVAFCRVTAMGFLRLITHSVTMGGAPLSVAEAWRIYREYRRLPGVALVGEPEGCEAALERWVEQQGTLLPKLWTDAYLAAVSVAGGYRLVSLDRDFARFDRLNFLHLDTP